MQFLILVMSSRLLDHALENYENKVIALEMTNSLPSTEQILDVLTARDIIHTLLSHRIAKFRKSPILLADLDNRLREKSESLTQAVDLSKFRTSFHPSPDAWWWFFETPKKKNWWDNYDRCWNIIAALAFVLALCILIDISTRILSGEPDTLGTIVVTLQTTITTLAIGMFLTKDGQEIIEKVFWWVRIPIYFKEEGRLVLAISLLACIVSFYLTLPIISNFYNSLGWEAYIGGHLTTARINYGRAIKFNPDNLKAQFNLGLLYEDINDLENARKEYLLVVQGNVLEGMNNLGRLYILQNQNSKASDILLNALASIEENGFSNNPRDNDSNLEYLLLKNLGWVRLKQNRYADAQINLERAIAINNEKASAHCLLASVLDKRDKKLSLPHWESCLRYGDKLKPDEDEWIGLAQQRLLPPK